MKFESFRNARVVRSSWLEEGGRRLDCNPYMSGALEARDALQALNALKEPLNTLTAGHAGGIYNGPMFVRNYVDSPNHGVPFITSGTMLLGDLSTLPLLRKKDAQSSRLSYLRLNAGTTLISCSGTIGRMVYVRPDMDGMWSSQDVLKVVPNESTILPGYLYAFLSSKFGVPLIAAGTYGAIIQHLEAEHIANLPVPRFGTDFENQVHGLIQSAAVARASAAALVCEGINKFLSLAELVDISLDPISSNFSFGFVQVSELTRFDATYFSPHARKATDALKCPSLNPKKLKDCARIFTPGIFKRMYVNDAEWGYAYYSGSELFEYSPEARGYLSKRAQNIADYLIEKDWLLIQDAGQVGGLIGHVTRATASVDKSVVSNHLMRIVPQSRQDSAYIFAALASPYGYRCIVRNAFGSSIPQLDPKHIGEIEIPWLDDERRTQVADSISRAWEQVDFADAAEKNAIALVEQAIDVGGN